MSFAIEVPGEAAPLSPFELVKALSTAATSTDNGQRQSAGQQLQAWESHPDYYAGLQSVYLDRSHDKQTRFLAIILLKNGIDKYWRHTARHAIPPEKKQLIRSRLFQGSLAEEDRALALHNALVTAKIVRIDYPDDWPDAFSSLIHLTQAASAADPLHLRGALQTLLRIVKEMGRARLRKSQTALQGVTPDLVRLLSAVYHEKTTCWWDYCSRGAGDEAAAAAAIDNSLTALKILRRLVTLGFELPHASPLVVDVWSLSQSQFDQFLGAIGSGSSLPQPLQDMIGKHLIQFAKLHIDMSEQHPASFPVLPNTIPLVKAYWNLVKSFSEVFATSGGIRQTSGGGGESGPKHEGPLFEKLALKGLLLLRSCVAIAHHPVQTFRYRSPEVKELERRAVQTLKAELLTHDVLLDMVQVIVSKLFVFRESDMEVWEEEPEEWEAQERTEGQAYEWAVRPCAERLLLDLLTNYRELGEPLLAYCNHATSADNLDIVTKEAAYCALGCSAAIIYQAFDFDGLLKTVLTKDVQRQEPLAKLLRRRIAILLSQWVTVKVAPESRPVVYDMYRHLLRAEDPHNDEVVRITAARQLKAVADDFQFDAEAFYPYAAEVLDALVRLLQEVGGDEARLAVLETVRVLVARMETHISQFGDAIMTILPKVWESAASEEYMIKQSVLAIMSALASSMRAESRRYHAAIAPLLREAMNPESPLHLHLIEESVDLWKAVLTQCEPPLGPDLAPMVRLALPLLEYDSEVANQCVEIVKDYILLAPQELLSDALRRPALDALSKALNAKSREQQQMAARCLELLIRHAEELGGVEGATVVAGDLVDLGVLRAILEGLRGNWEAAQTTGPNRKSPPLSTLKETDYFSLLARLALADPALLVRSLTAALGGSEADMARLWPWLADQWFANFDCMADPTREKLSCLALTRLCELPSPAHELVLGRLQDYLSMWTSVVTGLADGHGNDPTPEEGASRGEGAAAAAAAQDVLGAHDCLVWTEAGRYEYDSPLDVVEREFAFRDPVHRVVTFEFVKARLADLVARVGGEQAFEAEWAVNVDREVLEGFGRLSLPLSQVQQER
ncbi:hypothetical protein VTJ83DRAFT_395 [Remersonia thermophila]|uniref:Importin N-terminal domain-containing protein n=1 Tax=Remersonia thermophila TaxID=72144 RepID=A0ABR4DLX1_9PEZI